MRIIFMAFVSTLALLNTVSAAITGAHYRQNLDSSYSLSDNVADAKLFDRVAFYSNRNLARALEDLRITQSRVCLIVPIGDHYAGGKSGDIGQSERFTEFMLVMSERDFSINAGLGVTNQSPGILNIKDLAVNLLTRKSFSVEGLIVRVSPDAGAIVQMEWKEDRQPAADTSGRECWNQIFRANAGIIRTEMGRRT